MSAQEIIATLPNLKPEELRQVQAKAEELLLNEPSTNGSGRFTIDDGADGLPVIRAEGVITSAMVREIEGLAR